MLIKGKKKPASPPPSHALGQTDAANAMPAAEARDLPWTVENYEAGLVNDRRTGQRTERRRGYRRIEEKELISKAVEEAQAIKEQARHEGFEEGLQQSKEIVDSLKDAIAKLLSARDDALISAADDIGALAVEVAERIIKIDVMCDSSVVVSLVRDTIQKANQKTVGSSSGKTVLVKVHPDDLPIVKQALKEDPPPYLKAELIVMEDPTVDQGSCIVETNSGLIDASFSTQLGILRQLFGIVESKSSPKTS